MFSNGIVNTYTFNSATNAWTLGDDMRFPRWYPSVTPLTNGEMLITGGRPWIPEVRRTDGSVRELSEQTATMDVPFYPWMDVAPDGRVFYSGPDDNLRKLDPTGAGAWQSFGARGDGENRDYGSHALYDVGKILVAGGGPSSKTARTIDINGTTPPGLHDVADGLRAAPVQPHRRSRTGRSSRRAATRPARQYIDMNGGVYQAELWNPGDRHTGRRSPPSQVTRQYHSSALLLADGRVLSAGGGICDDCDTAGYLGKNAQIFTPAVPVQEGRLGRAGAASAPSRSAPSSAALRRRVPDHDPECGLDPQGGAAPARGGHALDQHGAALRAALVQRRQPAS